jgi:uncharacterized membrane protein YqjE
MTDERWSTWLLGRFAGAPDGAMRGVLSALWSFLQHPAATFEEHLAALEERLRVLEARLVGGLKTAADTGVVAVEETVEGVEHRLEEDFKRAIRGRVAGIQARLEIVKSRVVEDLKHELRRVVLMLALVMGCGVLALVGMTFGLMAAWTELEGSVGAVGASLVLAVVFLLASLVVFGLLRSVLRSQPLPSARKTAT